MQITESVVHVELFERSVDCFVLDYDRLLPSSWPRLTLVDQYEPAKVSPNSRRIDHITALELLGIGLDPSKVATRLGCHADTIRKIRRNATKAISAP